MAVPKEEKIAQELEMSVRCNMEVDLIDGEVKALKEGLISKEVFDHFMSIKSKVPVAERYTTLLKYVHETLQERLKKYEVISTNSDMNLTAIAKQAVREGLISKNVLVSISSLHHQVPLAMRTRYLLVYIQETLQKKLQSFKARLLGLNYGYIITCNQDLRSQCEKYSKMGFSFENVLMPLYPKKSENKISSQIHQLKYEKNLLNRALTTGNKIELCDMPLTQSGATATLGIQHLWNLNELLAAYSYNWKNIGVALNFQPQDLQTIEATPLLIPGAPKSYLLRLLQDWLQMTLRHTLPPTVENLKKALNSQTVGLGTLSSEVQAIVSKCTHDYALNQQSSSTKVSFDDKGPTYFPLYNEINIQEGESTLLEMVVITASKEDPVYTWVRRGMTLSSQPIICLHNADIAWDGDISCEVKASLTEPFSNVTVPITVHVSCPLDEFTQSLASMYLRRPEVPEDTWPPTGSKRYINLAIIKQQKVNYSSEYARFTIRGDIDDVLRDKQPIDYAKMYDSLERERQVMFIEGRPGSGKTTFVHKITRDWASNYSGGIRILLLVSLRMLNTLHKPTLSNILHLFRDLKATPEIIEKRDGKGVCFVFDGLDEFSPSDGKDSIVYKIIDRSYLHQSTVVVASRPAALARLRSKADKIIEVLGFTSDQIQEYFAHYPFSDATKPAKLKAYLSLHPNILHMCYLPIHATMVAFLFEVTGQVPKTETEIYSLFTRFTLMRSISKNKKLERNAGDNVLQRLNEEEKRNFKQICELALEKTLSNKQVLDHDEISFFFQITEDGDFSLGLITIDHTADLYGFKHVYTFLHLTFQEYLAAYHITTLSDEEQMKLIEEHGHKNHMLVVWKFFCGLVEFKPLQNKIKTILHKTQENTLHHFQCAYESQQEIVCAQLLKAVHYDIRLANKFLSTPDFTAIGYVTNKTIQPTKLSIKNCDVDIVAIDALLSEMEDTSKQSLESLHIEVKYLTPELMKKLLANFQSMKSLSLVSSLLSSVKEEDSIQLLQSHCEHFPVLKKIQTLTLKGLREKSQTFQIIITALKQCTNLTELSMTNNKIDEFGAKCLSRSLPHCRSLQRIDISRNGMSHAAILTVLNSIKHLKIQHMKEYELTNQGENTTFSHGLLLSELGQFRNLQSLDIVLYSEHTDIFLRSCKEWKDLTELRIDSKPQCSLQTTTAASRALQAYFRNIEILGLNNFIDNLEGAKSLTAGLKKCQSLKVLDLSYNQLEEKSLKPLLSVNFPKLEKLYLDNSSIGDSEVTLLSSHLKGFPSLQVVSLRYNHVTSLSAEALADLYCCTKLHLDLEGNEISTADLDNCLKNRSELRQDGEISSANLDACSKDQSKLHHCVKLKETSKISSADLDSGSKSQFELHHSAKLKKDIEISTADLDTGSKNQSDCTKLKDDSKISSAALDSGSKNQSELHHSKEDNKTSDYDQLPHKRFADHFIRLLICCKRNLSCTCVCLHCAVLLVSLLVYALFVTS